MKVSYSVNKIYQNQQGYMNKGKNEVFQDHSNKPFIS